MRPLDRYLQRWRIRIASRHIPAASRILDIGCHNGELFDYLGPKIIYGVGIDPLVERGDKEKLRFIRGSFPSDLQEDEGPFDVITILAVMEHIPRDQQNEFAKACHRALSPEGRLIASVPSPSVDILLKIGVRVGLIDGMSLEEHHGFSPIKMVPLFEQNGFRLVRRVRFQLGLNHLFVFEATQEAVDAIHEVSPPFA